MKEEQGQISFAGAVLMSINIMVGAGILFAVGAMTELAGSVSFLGWPLTAMLLFPIIWGLSKAAQLFPGSGGFYEYCSKGIAPIAGVIAQWGYFLGYMGTAASLATVLRNGVVTNTGSELLGEYPIILNVAFVGFYALINLISVSKISKVQSAGTLLKIMPIVLAIVAIVFFFGNGIEVDFSQMNKIGVTVSTVIFAFLGFEACCSIGGLLKGGPQKVGPVVLTGFLITMALYTLFHISLLFIMGPEKLAAEGAMAFPRYLGLSPSLGNALQVGISCAILLSWANSILGASLANISNLSNMAANKLVLGDKLLTKVNGNDRPIYAVGVYAALMFSFITLITDVNVLFALTNLGVITALSLTMVAVFLTHLRKKDYFQAAITSVSFGSCGAWIYYSVIQIPNPVYVAPLVVGLIAGVVMYKIHQARDRKQVALSE